MQGDPVKQEIARLEARLASSSPLDIKSHMKVSTISIAERLKHKDLVE
jgi:hypothetical protein